MTVIVRRKSIFCLEIQVHSKNNRFSDIRIVHILINIQIYKGFRVQAKREGLYEHGMGEMKREVAEESKERREGNCGLYAK